MMKNLDEHPKRYSPLQGKIETILLRRIYEGKHDGYTLETSLEILDAMEETH